MVAPSPGALDSIFGALADPTRRAIVARLARGDASVSELAEPFDVSLPAISKHLRVLEGAGLVAREKRGRVHRLRLLARPMQDAAEWIRRYAAFWEQRFDALADHLAEAGVKEDPSWPGAKRAPTPNRLSESNASSMRRAKKSSVPSPIPKS